MSLARTPRPHGDAILHPSPRAGGAWARPLILGVAAVLVGGCVWLTRTPAVDLVALTSVAVVMTLAVAASAVALGSRSRGRPTHRAAVQHLETSADPGAHVAGAATASDADALVVDETQASDGSDPPVDPDPALQQALSRVNHLEAALEEQSASLARLQAQVDDSTRREGELRRVELVLRALRERAGGSPESQSMLGRVEAAVSRLAPSQRPQRATLPTPVAGARAALVPPSVPTAAASSTMVLPPEPAIPSPPVGPRPEPAVALELTPAPASVPPPVGPMPEPAEASPPTVAATAAEPAAVPPIPDERVLPVPAPEPPPVTRAGRWRRRSTA